MSKQICRMMLLRLKEVVGSTCIGDGSNRVRRRNNLLFVGKHGKSTEPINQHVIFFPGDVQVNYCSKLIT